ncbi:hypothetical protein Pcinc_038367 [Petrolisthes cinctipes]|uniref:Uncharacterized protein n=1 Tax=Petrolisthes cinctipes TaxID=88211 RepID=A0AAE1BS02_PETCI|nr:hypothetical protein Pcinc_038367 [Petrolisthes cinctipes]
MEMELEDEEELEDECVKSENSNGGGGVVCMEEEEEDMGGGGDGVGGGGGGGVGGGRDSPLKPDMSMVEGEDILAKLREQEEGEGDEDSRDLVFRAEVLQRQRESLLSSPQALMNAVRAGGPPSLVPPSPHPHLPFIPATVGLPPTAQMPPTPGSAGSKDSSGNGGRTPSHTPEPHQSHQSWSFEEQFKQVPGNSLTLDLSLYSSP